jgi:hypothetical protein
MLSQIRLYIAPPQAESLRALAHFRLLVDGPWSGRCEWRVIDALVTELQEPRPPRVPALARVDTAGLVWLPIDPAAGIPANALDVPPGAPPAAAPAPDGSAAWRAAVETSPCATALFAGGLLVYANAAFRARYSLDESALGRRPGEWRQRSLDIDAALSGAPQAGVTVARIDGARSSLAVVYVVSGGEPGAQPLLDRIRTINHAIGNALVGVLGYGELLQRELERAQSPSVARVRAMNEAAARLETLSQEISSAIRAYLKQSES